MEFKKIISEPDYIEACKLRMKRHKKVAYFAIAADLLLWLVGATHFLGASLFGTPILAKGGGLLPIKTGEWAIVLLAWILVSWALYRWNWHKSYVKNWNLRNTHTYQVTSEGIDSVSSSGSRTSSPWSSFAFWQESRSVFVLVAPSNIFIPYPKSCMTLAQQDDFRAILQEVLPKK